MNQVPNHPRLFLRGSTYYFRASVPADIKSTFGKAEVVQSLKTKDLAEALPLLRQISAETDQSFAQHRLNLANQNNPASTVTEESASLSPSEYKQQCLEEALQNRLALFEAVKDDLQSFYEGELVALPDTQYFYDLSVDGTWEQLLAYTIRYWLKLELEGEKQRLKIGDFGEYSQWADNSAFGAHLFLKAKIEALEQLIEGSFSDESGLESVKPEIDSSERSKKVVKLSVIVDLYLEELARSNTPNKTIEGKRASLKEFIEICGDKEAHTYNKSDGTKYKTLLQRLPTYRNVHTKYQGLSAEQAAIKAKADKSAKLLAIKTINERLGVVSTFFGWADRNQDVEIKNPVDGLKLRESKRAGEKRSPFTANELCVIFSAPIFVGCKSSVHWGVDGDLVLRDSSKFWVPLIGLFTGMRLGEIIQLHAEDIREDSGIRFFDVCRETKNVGSQRNIPVHKELISCGLMQFLSSKNGGRIFSDYEQAKSGSWSDTFSKHFARFLEGRAVDGSFHCFRHNFEKACLASGVPPEIVDALQGHSQKGMRAVYGSSNDPFGLKLPALELQKLNYDGLDLSHLHIVEEAE